MVGLAMAKASIEIERSWQVRDSLDALQEMFSRWAGLKSDMAATYRRELSRPEIALATLAFGPRDYFTLFQMAQIHSAAQVSCCCIVARYLANRKQSPMSPLLYVNMPRKKRTKPQECCVFPGECL